MKEKVVMLLKDNNPIQSRNLYRWCMRGKTLIRYLTSLISYFGNYWSIANNSQQIFTSTLTVKF